MGTRPGDFGNADLGVGSVVRLVSSSFRSSTFGLDIDSGIMPRSVGYLFWGGSERRTTFFRIVR
jgi:hypothetical protein